MRHLWPDIRYSVRIFVRIPDFALAAMLTLGLAIAANTTIFTVINGVLFAPLPYYDPSRLVVISNVYGANRTASSVPDYLDRVRDGTTLKSIAAFRPRDFSLVTDAAAEHLSGALVSASFFDVLAVQPALGRLFTNADDQPGANDVVILSDSAWRRYFGSDPRIVGKQVTLDGAMASVIGVMPPQFRMPLRDGEIWRPIAFTAAQMSPAERGNENLTTIGRIQTGLTIDQVSAEMRAIAARAVDNGGTRRQFLVNAKFSAAVLSLTEQTIGSVRQPMLVLLGASGLVLLIALANIANLILARASGRSREIFIRSSLGAGRGRIAAQLMTENILLALLAGIAGLTLAVWGVRSVALLDVPGIPRLNELAGIGVDSGMIVFAFALSLTTGIVFGALPAWTLSRLTYDEAGAGSRGAAGSGRRIRQVAAVLQIAVAIILLVGAGLLIESVRRLMSVDPGFKTESRVAFRVALPPSIYPNDASRSAFFSTLTDRLQRVPGVRAGISTLSPFDIRNDTATFHVEGVEEPAGAPQFGSELREISGDYPTAIGMPLLLGRTFNDQDRDGSPLVVLVDQRTAERFWPGYNPIGKRLSFGKAWRDVVGVVGTVKNERLDAQGQYQIYIPFLQSPQPNMTVVLHAASDAGAVIRAAQETVKSLDRNVPLFDFRTLDERIRESLAPRRYSMMVLGGLGAAGLFVSLIGVYGVLAYAVRQRAHEIGVRIALGAQRTQVVWMIVGEGLRLALAGVVLGIIGAFGLTRFLGSMLYSVKSTDPLTFAAVSATMLVAAALASYLPAWRAALLDPVGALREE